MKRKYFVLPLVVFLSIFFACSCHQHSYLWEYSENAHYQKCKGCNKVINESPHEGVWNVTQESDCTKPGERELKCITCDYLIDKKSIPIKNHVYENFTSFGSCTEDTLHGTRCINCDLVSFDSVTACTGHNMSDWEKEIENTCSQVGLEKRTCLNENCDFEETREIKKVNHDFQIEHSIAREDLLLFQCKNCGISYTRHSDDECCEYCDTVELFDQNLDFSFKIISSENEDYIQEHLKIVLNYLNESEEESQGLIDYEIIDEGNEVWNILGHYQAGETYIAKIDGNLRFENYITNNIIFTTTFKNKNIVDFNSKMKFITDFTINNYNENSECYYINVKDVSSLTIGDILCIGDIASKEELDELKKSNSDVPDVKFGKIKAIYRGENDWQILLTYPELDEIFEELDIYEKENIDLEELGIDTNAIKSDAKASFCQSEDFIDFLAVYHETSETYVLEKGYDPISFERDTKGGIQISMPVIKVSGTKLSVWIKGSAYTPIKSKGETIGNISVDFTAKAEIQFIFSLNLNLKKWWIFVVGINYIDMQLKQLDSFKFDFDIKMNIDYTTEVEEKNFVYNTDPYSHKLHMKNCRYLKNIKDESKLEYLTDEEAYQKYQNGLASECLICLPIERLNRDAFVINVDRNIFHCLNCHYVGEMKFSNALFSNESAKSLNAKGYSYCKWCQPEARDSRDFEERMLQNLKYENWKDHIDEIKQWAKDSNVEEYKDKGIHLASLHFNVAVIFTVNLDINLIIDFKLEASLNYNYELSHELIYGMRVQNGRVQTYNSSKEHNSKNDLNLIGKTELNLGVQADAYISVVGLSRYIRAGFTAEVGVYANASGIIHQNSKSNENYGGAYLEVGIYVNIDAYYKLFRLNGNLAIYHNKYPIIQFGFDKVYYSFVDPIEYLSLSDNYKLDENKFLRLEYMNVKTLVSGEEVLSFDNKSNLYTVEVTLLEGKYCEFENGLIRILDTAPCRFEDVLRIKIIGNTSWNKYVPNSSTFCLEDYIIPIYYYNENGHQYSILDSEPANCFSDGFILYKCDICDKEKTEIENQLNHIQFVNIGFAPSCWENGLTDETICTLCNTVLIESEIIPVLGHKFDENGICLHCNLAEENSFSVGLAYKLNDNGLSYSVIGVGGNQDINLIIPTTYLDLPVTKIEKKAFANSNYVSINTGDGIDTIEEDAFINSSSLHNLKVGKNVKTINSNPFSYCNKLEYIIVDIENTSFISMDNCILSSNKTTLFVGCKNSVIPESVTNIRLMAFCGCNELATITIPKNIDTLQPKAFYDCTKLETLVLPESIKYINYKCFELCNLKHIFYMGTESTWKNVNLDSDNALLDEIVFFFSEDEPIEAGNYWHFVNNEIRIWQ